MANRVLLNSSGLKVSKPGVNVLTAGASGLQFSSDWSALGIHDRVEMDCNWNETDFRNYSLGKTFPSPPMVQFHRVMSSGQVQWLSALSGFYWSEGADPNRHNVEAEVTTTHVRIKSWLGGTGPLFRLRYTVFDYNL